MGMGGGGSGQLGDGNCDERSIPFRLSGLDCVLARSAGRDLTMALKRNGKYGCTVEVLTWTRLVRGVVGERRLR